MKKILILILAVLILLLGAGGYVLTQKSAVERILPWLINRNTTDFAISEFRIGRQEYRFPDAVLFEQICLTVKQKKQVYRIEIKKVDVRGILNVIPGSLPVPIDLVSVEVSSADMELRQGLVQLAVKTSGSGEEKVAGHLRIAKLRREEYHLTNISADISGDLSFWRFKNFYAEFYGGRLQGKILLDSKNQMVYSVRMQVEEVDLKQLQPVNPEFFSKVKGTVAGSLDVAGTPSGIRTINANFSVSKGGEIKASLLNYLLRYIPANSSQRKDLEKLIKSDGDVPLDRAAVEIKSLTEEKLSSRIKLFSQRFNLDLDVTLDVSVDGGFQNLLDYPKNLLQLIGGK